jgi:hypothetical protein
LEKIQTNFEEDTNQFSGRNKPILGKIQTNLREDTNQFGGIYKPILGKIQTNFPIRGPDNTIL